MIPTDLRAEIRRLFFAEHWCVGTIATRFDACCCLAPRNRRPNSLREIRFWYETSKSNSPPMPK